MSKKGIVHFRGGDIITIAGDLIAKFGGVFAEQKVADMLRPLPKKEESIVRQNLCENGCIKVFSGQTISNSEFARKHNTTTPLTEDVDSFRNIHAAKKAKQFKKRKNKENPQRPLPFVTQMKVYFTDKW